ncbi:MAG TPA: hypothetical protein PK639_00240 [Candidatus Woesebacteria bacterium]|nr:hypothetical protein [Candidatus Woesebacteria bacterium]
MLANYPENCPKGYRGETNVACFGVNILIFPLGVCSRCDVYWQNLDKRVFERHKEAVRTSQPTEKTD